VSLSISILLTTQVFWGVQEELTAPTLGRVVEIETKRLGPDFHIQATDPRDNEAPAGPTWLRRASLPRVQPNGVARPFLVCARLAGWRYTTLSAHARRTDWAGFVRALREGHYRAAKKFVLVMSQASTKTLASMRRSRPGQLSIWRTGLRSTPSPSTAQDLVCRTSSQDSLKLLEPASEEPPCASMMFLA
jgi:hypothetical protein